MAKEAIIKYLCLVYYDGVKLAALSRDAQDALMREARAYCEDVRGSGRYIASDIPCFRQPVATIRVQSGSVSIDDGVSAPARTSANSAIIIDARDLNDAIRVVSRLPTAHLGTIEIRPIPELLSAELERNHS